MYAQQVFQINPLHAHNESQVAKVFETHILHHKLLNESIWKLTVNQEMPSE